MRKDVKTEQSERQQDGKPRRVDFNALRMIEPAAAGIDIGAKEHWVAVPPDCDARPVRSFTTFTRDLHALADWLETCGIKTVAMESTGVYWVALYELLEARGMAVCLVNAKHVKNVPGRKTDVLDCQWLQKLHSYGLLQASFRPHADFVRLRTYVRHRDNLVTTNAMHTQRMQKALTLMNVQLHRVISDVTGETGMRIIREIVAGNHDPEALARHRDYRCKANNEEIADALRGEYREEHLFTLRQELELHDAYVAKITECDREIERLIGELSSSAAQVELPPMPAPKHKPTKRRLKEGLFEVREPLYRITRGVDLLSTAGLGELTALQLLSEIGTDMSRWPSAKHFASWTTLAPGSRISGGKQLSSRRPPSAHRVAQILRLAAVAAGRTETAIGAFYRRLAARIGKGKAVVATAAKLARRIYMMLKTGETQPDEGAKAYELRYRSRILKSLKRRAAELGYNLTELATTET
jgi:transposase